MELLNREMTEDDVFFLEKGQCPFSSDRIYPRSKYSPKDLLGAKIIAHKFMIDYVKIGCFLSKKLSYLSGLERTILHTIRDNFDTSKLDLLVSIQEISDLSGLDKEEIKKSIGNYKLSSFLEFTTKDGTYMTLLSQKGEELVFE